ncbi:MAG TPA: hypothetical protein DCS97_09865 [Planctomycetes bacterium]|nr:hypothetical protein [Planctomycetota bacterium]
MAMLTYEGNQIELSGECFLGRQRECGVVIRDSAASRKHARVFQAEGCWWVEDLGSANGTRHNGSEVKTRIALRNGDAIRIGEAEVVFHCSERESAPERKPDVVRLDPQSLEGREINGYRVGKLLGRSGMGFLYQATQSSLQREVAFKVFSRKIIEQDPTFAERLRELASRSGNLRHDGFVQLHENGIEDGLPWYSMELVQGDTLAHLVEREGRFQPELALLVCERVALAMAEAHKAGIIHRDLAPRTIMLTATGQVKILDLGIASVLGRGRDHQRPEAAWHCAPEVATKAEPAPADDTYALGCVMHHLLTGAPPFTGVTAEAVFKAHAQEMIPILRKTVPGLPAAVEELHQSLLNKNSDWRLADMADVAKTLRQLRECLGQAVAAAQGQAARMVERAAASQRRTERSMLGKFIIMALIGLLVLVGALVLPGQLRRGTPDPVPPPIATPANPSLPAFQAATPTVTARPAATVDANLERVRGLRARFAAKAASWPVLEQEAADLTASVPATSAAAGELRLLRTQIADDAEAWYRAELAKLPAVASGSSGMRLTALARLRDEAAAAERIDAEVRYQEELAVLVQRLNEVRRQSRRALEAGRPGDLPGLAAALAPSFNGTPVAGLQRQFAILCTEAATLATGWKGDWRLVSSGFERARGERALAAAAALLITGEHVRARRILLADPQLGQGALLSRREALMGGLAAVLAFDDPTDLQYLDIASGEPALSGGALSGKAGDAAALVCTIPIGGADWQADALFTVAGADGEIVLTCVAQGQSSFMLRLAEGQAVLNVAKVERASPTTITGQRRVRLSCRGGELRVLLDGRALATYDKTPVPAGSSLRLELAGSDWRLEELQVVGGR